MRLRGLLFPSKGPHLFLISFWAPRFTWIFHRLGKARARLNLRYRSHGFHAPQHRNLRLPEYVLDFRFLKPRGVILER